MSSPWVPYWQKLKSDKCACGMFKAPKMSFCKTCYYSLPDSSQRALYKSLGSGYEGAYDRAVSRLVKLGRIKEVPDE